MDDLFQDVSLSLGAFEVAVSDIANAAISKGLTAVKKLLAGSLNIGRTGFDLVVDVIQIGVEPLKLFIGFDVDFHASDGIDHCDETSEVDGDIIGDGRVEIVIDRFDGKLGAAQRIGGIEFVIAVVGNFNIGVPHERGDFEAAVLKIGG